MPPGNGTYPEDRISDTRELSTNDRFRKDVEREYHYDGVSAQSGIWATQGEHHATLGYNSSALGDAQSQRMTSNRPQQSASVHAGHQNLRIGPSEYTPHQQTPPMYASQGYLPAEQPKQATYLQNQQGYADHHQGTRQQHTLPVHRQPLEYATHLRSQRASTTPHKESIRHAHLQPHSAPNTLLPPDQPRHITSVLPIPLPEEMPTLHEAGDKINVPASRVRTTSLIMDALEADSELANAIYNHLRTLRDDKVPPNLQSRQPLMDTERTQVPSIHHASNPAHAPPISDAYSIESVQEFPNVDAPDDEYAPWDRYASPPQDSLVGLGKVWNGVATGSDSDNSGDDVEPPGRHRPVQLSDSNTPNMNNKGNIDPAVSTQPVVVDTDIIDPWLNESFHELFKWEMFGSTDGRPVENYLSRLRTHYVMRSIGGRHNNGTVDAVHPSRGKQSCKECQGVLVCSLEDCACTARPKHNISKKRLEEDEHARGFCDIHKTPQPRRYVSCKVKVNITAYEDGVIFEQIGEHEHEKPPALHLTLSESARLDKHIKRNRNAKPAELLAGAIGSDGETTPVADISNVLGNKGRLSHELNKRKEPRKELILWLPVFAKDHPEFVTNVTFAMPHILVHMKTKFMNKEAYKVWDPSRNDNGFLCDAAHKFLDLDDYAAILIMIGAFCLQLRRWVPLFYTISLGQSTDCYCQHFFEFFRALEQAFREEGKDFSHKDVKGMVVDYSQAQKKGFCEAYAKYFSERYAREPGHEKYTYSYLLTKANSCLKGCEFHLQKNITALSKSLDSDTASAFQCIMDKMIAAESHKRILKLKERLITRFPEFKGWIDWWLRSNIAPLVFTCYVSMKEATQKSLPDTTNAEESLNWSLYSHVGSRKTTVVAAIESIRYFSEALFADLERVLLGYNSNYGKKSRMEVQAERYGTTHPGRRSKIGKQSAKEQRLEGSTPPKVKFVKERTKTYQTKLKKALKATSSEEFTTPKKNATKNRTYKSKTARRIPDSEGQSSTSNDESSARSQSTLDESLKNLFSDIDSEQGDTDNSTDDSRDDGHSTGGERMVESSDVEETPTRRPTAHKTVVVFTPQRKILKPAAVASVTKYPQAARCSFPYNNNSCWLDTSLEVIFWTFFPYTESLQFLSSKSGANGTSLSLLHDIMLRRKEMVDGGVDESALADFLVEKRDNLRQALADTGHISNTTSKESLFIWWSSILCTKLKGEEGPSLTTKEQDMFFPTLETVRICRSDSSQGSIQHIQYAKQLKRTMQVAVPQDRYKECNGRLYSFLLSRIQMDHATDTLKKCWRNDASAKRCNGVAQICQFWVSMPLCLIFEFNTDDFSRNTWDIHRHMALVGEMENGREVECVYELVARVYYDKEVEHFTASIITCAGEVRDYDDLHRNGQLHPSAHRPSTISGMTEPYSTKVTTAVVYRMQGGSPKLEALNRRLARNLSVFELNLRPSGGGTGIDYVGKHFAECADISWMCPRGYVENDIVVNGEEATDVSGLGYVENDAVVNGEEAKDVSSSDVRKSKSKKRTQKKRKPSTTDAAVVIHDNKSPAVPDTVEVKKTKRRKLNPIRQTEASEIEVSERLASSDDDAPYASEKSDDNIPYASEKFFQLFPHDRPGLFPVECVADSATQEVEYVRLLERLPQLDKETRAELTMSAPKSSNTGKCKLGCECGDTETVDVLELSEPIIQCRQCRKWVHCACTFLGYYSVYDQAQRSYEKSDVYAGPFVCHSCRAKSTGESLRRFEDTQLGMLIYDRVKSMRSRPLPERLWPGRYCLAKLPTWTFYYPARVVQVYSVDRHLGGLQVKFWKHCDFVPGYRQSLSDSLLSSLPWSCVVDELWGDRAARRMIRLGKYIHPSAPEAHYNTDLVIDEYLKVPVDDYVRAALEPHIQTLHEIYEKEGNDEEFYKLDVPVIKVYRENRTNIRTRRSRKRLQIEPEFAMKGYISTRDEAMVYHWLYDNLHVTAKTTIEGMTRWLGRFVSTHALTLLLAAKMNVSVADAFCKLNTGLKRDTRDPLGIDIRGLGKFEEWLYSIIWEMGTACLHQWGLDVGPRQQGGSYERADDFSSDIHKFEEGKRYWLLDEVGIYARGPNYKEPCSPQQQTPNVDSDVRAAEDG